MSRTRGLEGLSYIWPGGGNMGGGDAAFNRHAILPDKNVMQTTCRAECHICISVLLSVLLLQFAGLDFLRDALRCHSSVLLAVARG